LMVSHGRGGIVILEALDEKAQSRYSRLYCWSEHQTPRGGHR
jgi:hypothetical protein